MYTLEGKVRHRYMVLKKSGNFPRYDERVTERGFDNVEYVEKIRHMSRSLAVVWSRCEDGPVSSEFLFPSEWSGVDISDHCE